MTRPTREELVEALGKATANNAVFVSRLLTHNPDDHFCDVAVRRHKESYDVWLRATGH